MRPSKFSDRLERAITIYRGVEARASATRDSSGLGPAWANLLLTYGHELTQRLSPEARETMRQLGAIAKLLEPYEPNGPALAKDFLFAVAGTPVEDVSGEVVELEEYLMGLTGSKPQPPNLKLIT